MSETFIYKTRIYYQDTDVGGLVYHSKYIDFAERARMELLFKEGIPPSVLETKYGVSMIIRSCEVKYLAPAKLEDELIIKTNVTALKGATMNFRQLVYKGDTLLVEMNLTAVCIKLNYKPTKPPKELQEKLEKYV